MNMKITEKIQENEIIDMAFLMEQVSLLKTSLRKENERSFKNGKKMMKNLVIIENFLAENLDN